MTTTTTGAFQKQAFNSEKYPEIQFALGKLEELISALLRIGYTLPECYFTISPNPCCKILYNLSIQGIQAVSALSKEEIQLLKRFRSKKYKGY